MLSVEENTNVETIERYVDYINRNSSKPEINREKYLEFYSEDVRYCEMPSIFRSKGRSGGFDQIIQALETDRKQISDELFTAKRIIASGDMVALECEWKATIKLKNGLNPPGTLLTADAAIVFRLRNGKIIEENDYFCFAKPET
ncbi:MAG: nuclear transport factor 2 family protein [Desulfobacteraceae bacterium]|nr:nuclear transport factor 2 family protein [Desulfobacteraceae bacterium]MBU4053353.1 ester cyclase [Pseudomonadota bacterium]